MLIITLGDPFSVNIELVASVLAPSLAAPTVPIVLVGSTWHWQDQCARLGLESPDYSLIADWTAAIRPGLYFADLGQEEDAVPAELLSRALAGALAVRSLAWVRQVPKSLKHAVLTAPIDKHSCQQAGFSYPGQTEFFEDMWQSQAVMILAGPRLRVGLVTNHLPLAKVTKSISEELVVAKLELFIASLQSAFGLPKPRVAVAGLNPHAGDKGLFGVEDTAIVASAVRRVATRWHETALVHGPLPADTIFYRAFSGGYDGVLAMYHDQGLGPLKTVHFDDAVNLSGGLPHLRVSPDHGPASDLFLTRKASPRSFSAAFALAKKYLEGE